MDELKVLVDIVKELPNAVLYVLGGFLFYKLFITGSIVAAMYGGFKLLIIKWHDWQTNKHVVKNCTTKVSRLTISGEFEPLLSQLERLVGMTTNIGSDYIHSSDIRWLGEAITEKMARDKEKESLTSVKP